jgi:hypothetical protein
MLAQSRQRRRLLAQRPDGGQSLWERRIWPDGELFVELSEEALRLGADQEFEQRLGFGGVWGVSGDTRA